MVTPWLQVGVLEFYSLDEGLMSDMGFCAGMLSALALDPSSLQHFKYPHLVGICSISSHLNQMKPSKSQNVMLRCFAFLFRFPGCLGCHFRLSRETLIKKMIFSQALSCPLAFDEGCLQVKVGIHEREDTTTTGCLS